MRREDEESWSIGTQKMPSKDVSINCNCESLNVNFTQTATAQRRPRRATQ